MKGPPKYDGQKPFPPTLGVIAYCEHPEASPNPPKMNRLEFYDAARQSLYDESNPDDEIPDFWMNHPQWHEVQPEIVIGLVPEFPFSSSADGGTYCVKIGGAGTFRVLTDPTTERMNELFSIFAFAMDSAEFKTMAYALRNAGWFGYRNPKGTK